MCGAARRGAQTYGQAVLVIQQRPLTSALKRTTYLQVTDNIITRVHILPTSQKWYARKNEKKPPPKKSLLKNQLVEQMLKNMLCSLTRNKQLGARLLLSRNYYLFYSAL